MIDPVVLADLKARYDSFCRANPGMIVTGSLFTDAAVAALPELIVAAEENRRLRAALAEVVKWQPWHAKPWQVVQRMASKALEETT